LFDRFREAYRRGLTRAVSGGRFISGQRLRVGGKNLDRFAQNRTKQLQHEPSLRFKRTRQSALAALRCFGSDTVTASGVADGFVTAGAVIAAWPVREAAPACLPNVIALPSHQSSVIGPSLSPKDDGLFCVCLRISGLPVLAES
jgi:hypothetical protein